MPLHPANQKLIAKVEELSGKPVHVKEDSTMQLMATVNPARGASPAHFLNYRPRTKAVDYLVAYQLGFLIRLFSCPAEERVDVAALPHEQQHGIEAMGLANAPSDFARMMISSISQQLRSYSVGMRVDHWIWHEIPELREQQIHSVQSQLAENARALAPEIRQEFPKALVDANTTMNAAYAEMWSVLLDDKRVAIPFRALGYASKAAKLLVALREVPDQPAADRLLIDRWAEVIGLKDSFHFSPLSTH